MWCRAPRERKHRNSVAPLALYLDSNCCPDCCRLSFSTSEQDGCTARSGCFVSRCCYSDRRMWCAVAVEGGSLDSQTERR